MVAFLPIIAFLVVPLLLAAYIKLFAKLFKAPLRWPAAIGFAYLAIISHSIGAVGLMHLGVVVPLVIGVLAGLLWHILIAVPFFKSLAQLPPTVTIKIIVLADVAAFVTSALLMVFPLLLVAH
ncbi:hypothetical protein [Chitiniphilus shinanonensis]|uniref:hypothetical protein n=1 Tax=Chitiniphilus shinanonensis TaxID=553088 RepID=UPI00333FF741